MSSDKQMSNLTGVSALLNTLTRTMDRQGADIKDIAQMQEYVCRQFDILLPDEFFVKNRCEIRMSKGEIDIYEHLKDFLENCFEPVENKKSIMTSKAYDSFINYLKKNDINRTIINR